MTTTMNTDYDNWLEFKEGMLIRTKRDVRTTSCCYSGAKWQTIKKNTVLMLTDATSRGHVSPRIVGYFDEGDFTPAHDCNGWNLRGMKADHFLGEGLKSRCPEDFGLGDPTLYEIVGQPKLVEREGLHPTPCELLKWYIIQAPFRCTQWKRNPLILVHRDGKFTFDEGYYNKEKGWDRHGLCYDGGTQ